MFNVGVCMDVCKIKSGFFILRNCNSEAVSVCTSCGRSMCHHHSAINTRPLVCIDCSAVCDESASTQNVDNKDHNWPYNYRHQYYSYQSSTVILEQSEFNDDNFHEFDADSNSELINDLVDSDMDVFDS